MLSSYNTFIDLIHKDFCFGLFSLLSCTRSVNISLLIQTRFFTGKNTILDRGLVFWKQRFQFQMCWWWICLLETLSFSVHSLWIIYGLLWCFNQLFGVSFDGTHSLQRIHWWDSKVMLTWWTNSYTHLGWPKGKTVFSCFIIILWWTVPLAKLESWQFGLCKGNHYLVHRAANRTLPR